MRMRNIKYITLLAGLLGLASVPGPSLAVEAFDEKGRALEAEAPGEKGRIPTLGEIFKVSGVDIGGYIDTSYTYSGNGNVTFKNGEPNRIFDREPNSFNFNMAELYVAMQPDEGFGGVVVLNAGTDASIISAAGSGSRSDFDVQQAFVSYKAGGAHLMFGKLVTLVGAEVIESPENLNFSRSILFGYAIPFTHTGVRLHYDINDMLSTTVGVNNGWDNLKDNNKQKSVEVAISITPSDMFSLSIQGMSGIEDGASTETGIVLYQGNRSLIDAVATINATEQLTLVINADYGIQKNGTETGTAAKWWGVAGYGNYQFTEQWRMALRGEYFDDRDGFRTGIRQRWKEVTTTLAFAPTEFVELRGEYRHDHSNVASFLKSNGHTRKTQDTAAFEAIYKF